MGFSCGGASSKWLVRPKKIDARSDVLNRLGELTALVARMAVKVSSRPGSVPTFDAHVGESTAKIAKASDRRAYTARTL